MEPDGPLPLHARVRWGNVARAAALLALVAIILAWPHLRAREPVLPPAEPVPVAPAPPPTTTSVAAPQPVAPPAIAPRPRARR
ncbi:MAG: hypothetical protein M3N04_03640, partial [Actinomycetota bacterium]|nr:hypothetical protein [Actinomycetota bacterium]